MGLRPRNQRHRRSTRRHHRAHLAQFALGIIIGQRQKKMQPTLIAGRRDCLSHLGIKPVDHVRHNQPDHIARLVPHGPGGTAGDIAQTRRRIAHYIAGFGPHRAGAAKCTCHGGGRKPGLPRNILDCNHKETGLRSRYTVSIAPMTRLGNSSETPCHQTQPSGNFAK